MSIPVALLEGGLRPFESAIDGYSGRDHETPFTISAGLGGRVCTLGDPHLADYVAVGER